MTGSEFRHAQAVRGYIKSNPVGFLSIGLPFLLLSAIVASLSMLSVALSVLALCLLLLPYHFAATTMIARVGRLGEMPTNKEIWTRSIAYFHTPFIGSYRVLLNILKMIGFGLLGMLLGAVIIALSLGAADPSFYESFQTMMNLYVQNDYSSFEAYVLAQTSLLNWIDWTVLCGIGVGFCALCWTLSDYAMNPLVKTRVIAFPNARFSSDYYNRFFRLVRTKYWKTLLLEGYGVVLLPVLGYAGGAVLGILLKLPLNFTIAVALGIAGLLLSLAMPYYLALVEEFFRHRRKETLFAQQKMMEYIYSRFSNVPNAPDKELESMRQDIEKTKNQLQNLDESQNVDEEPEGDEPSE